MNKLLLTVFALLALACKPGPGSACEPGELRCLDSRRALACQDGKLIETPCRGRGGCLTLQETTTCDISGNQPGDVCVSSDEGVAVCASDDAMLSCRAGTLVRVPCRGAKGCETLGGRTSCDQSVAKPRDACSGGDKACSADGHSVLGCAAGAMSELYRCRGQQGCAAAGGKLSCDQTIAQQGDACDRGLDGHVACSLDRKALLRCDGARFVPSEKCKPGTVCTVSGQSTSCARP